MIGEYFPLRAHWPSIYGLGLSPYPAILVTSVPSGWARKHSVSAPPDDGAWNEDNDDTNQEGLVQSIFHSSDANPDQSRVSFKWNAGYLNSVYFTIGHYS